jgi:hypothetical protein
MPETPSALTEIDAHEAAGDGVKVKAVVFVQFGVLEIAKFWLFGWVSTPISIVFVARGLVLKVSVLTVHVTVIVKVLVLDAMVGKSAKEMVIVNVYGLLSASAGLVDVKLMVG